MGSSDNRRAAHWSSGEYPDANNTEDDVAIISKVAPALADDHGNASIGGTCIASGTTTTGTITSRTDVDAFTFSANNNTLMTVAGPNGYSNLDVQLTIYTSLGVRVATVDPTADTASDASMAASWTASLSATPATYTAVVDGTGN